MTDQASGLQIEGILIFKYKIYTQKHLQNSKFQSHCIQNKLVFKKKLILVIGYTS